jgi:hypothetical protein
MFPAVTSSCEVTYLDEMPFEMSDEYFDAGVNVAEKFGVIVVNGVVQVTFPNLLNFNEDYIFP